jgi:hypothetical protein
VLARACATVLAAGLLALSGCGPAKLEVKKTKTVAPQDYELVGLQKQPEQQKITVEVDASEPVNILVIDSASEPGFDGKSPEQQQALAKYGKKMGVKKDSLAADVPANTAVTVAIGGAPKTAEVKYSISNRK